MLLFWGGCLFDCVVFLLFVVDVVVVFAVVVLVIFVFVLFVFMFVCFVVVFVLEAVIVSVARSSSLPTGIVTERHCDRDCRQAL